MKTNLFSFLMAIVLVMLSSGCKKETHRVTFAKNEAAVVAPVAADNSLSADNSISSRNPSGTCNPNAYTILLESRSFVNGNWEWIWSVQNPNPGNGNNGTTQNLSHWGMQFGACFVWTSVVSASYSGDGTTWTSFTPLYQIDPSQNCMTSPLLKFDFGTTGTAKSYYKIVVSQEYPIGWVPGYYKSGANTGCCIFNFMGIGCPGVAEER